MMYLPELNLWDRAISSAIRNGQIKLQPGQWLRCGAKNQQNKPCRFVRLTQAKTLWVVHWQGSAKATNEKFLDAARVNRKLNKASGDFK